jgi:hypothetical protein
MTLGNTKHLLKSFKLHVVLDNSGNPIYLLIWFMCVVIDVDSLSLSSLRVVVVVVGVVQGVGQPLPLSLAFWLMYLMKMISIVKLNCIDTFKTLGDY